MKQWAKPGDDKNYRQEKAGRERSAHVPDPPTYSVLLVLLTCFSGAL